MLFRHDEAGQPTDVRLVDLQLTRRARPALELGYFFGTCTSPEFQAEHLDDLLEFYHCRLAHFYAATRGSGAADTSIPLPYTLDSLKKDFKDCFAHGHAVGAFHILASHTVCQGLSIRFFLKSVFFFRMISLPEIEMQVNS